MQQELTSKRLTLLVRPEVTIDLEYSDQFPILHFFSTGDFSKETFKFCRDYSYKLAEFFYDMGYEGMLGAVIDPTHKMDKLCLMIGFTYRGDSIGKDDDGIEYMFRIYEYTGVDDGRSD